MDDRELLRSGEVGHGRLRVEREDDPRRLSRVGHEPEERELDDHLHALDDRIVISVSEKVYRDRYDEPDKLAPDGNAMEWPVPYWWIDAGASMMAVLLAAVDEGLTAGFLGVHKMPELALLLGIPKTHYPIGVVTIGFPRPLLENNHGLSCRW